MDYTKLRLSGGLDSRLGNNYHKDGLSPLVVVENPKCNGR